MFLVVANCSLFLLCHLVVEDQWHGQLKHSLCNSDWQSPSHQSQYNVHDITILVLRRELKIFPHPLEISRTGKRVRTVQLANLQF